MIKWFITRFMREGVEAIEWVMAKCAEISAELQEQNMADIAELEEAIDIMKKDAERSFEVNETICSLLDGDEEEEYYFEVEEEPVLLIEEGNNGVEPS